MYNSKLDIRYIRGLALTHVQGPMVHDESFIPAQQVNDNKVLTLMIILIFEEFFGAKIPDMFSAALHDNNNCYYSQCYYDGYTDNGCRQTR